MKPLFLFFLLVLGYSRCTDTIYNVEDLMRLKEGQVNFIIEDGKLVLETQKIVPPKESYSTRVAEMETLQSNYDIPHALKMARREILQFIEIQNQHINHAITEASYIEQLTDEWSKLQNHSPTNKELKTASTLFTYGELLKSKRRAFQLLKLIDQAQLNDHRDIFKEIYSMALAFKADLQYALTLVEQMRPFLPISTDELGRKKITFRHSVKHLNLLPDHVHYVVKILAVESLEFITLADFDNLRKYVEGVSAQPETATLLVLYRLEEAVAYLRALWHLAPFNFPSSPENSFEYSVDNFKPKINPIESGQFNNLVRSKCYSTVERKSLASIFKFDLLKLIKAINESNDNDLILKGEDARYVETALNELNQKVQIKKKKKNKKKKKPLKAKISVAVDVDSEPEAIADVDSESEAVADVMSEQEAVVSNEIVVPQAQDNVAIKPTKKLNQPYLQPKQKKVSKFGILNDILKPQQTLKWNTFANLMERAGFRKKTIGNGSSFKFILEKNGHSKPLCIHKGHPNSDITKRRLELVAEQLMPILEWEKST